MKYLNELLATNVKHSRSVCNKLSMLKEVTYVEYNGDIFIPVLLLHTLNVNKIYSQTVFIEHLV